MKRKYIVEISETYTFQVDNNMADCCYATIEDLDNKILTMIDSDDIHSWTPVGSKEFVDKFAKLYGGGNTQTIETEVSVGYDYETQGLIDF
jgi:hypothetical protein